jgi:ppGpp synthetase/RelA/SpoT-type nucleotidyltranferase
MEPSFDEILEDYKEFLEIYTQSSSSVLEKYYNDVVSIMASDFEQSKFLNKLNDNLKIYNEVFISKNNFELFEKIENIKIVKKPYDSMIEKCFRRDILEKGALKTFLEHNYDELENKYIEHTPLNCYSKFEDIIRTRITTKYMDGALFFLEQLKKLINEFELKSDEDYKAQDDGYYALHLNVNYTFEIPDFKRNVIKFDSKVEIQINTSIQNLLIELTHKYYTTGRHRLIKPDIEWQWKYDCDEFTPYYLGHITHYIEGAMVNIRNKVTL